MICTSRLSGWQIFATSDELCKQMFHSMTIRRIDSDITWSNATRRLEANCDSRLGGSCKLMTLSPTETAYRLRGLGLGLHTWWGLSSTFRPPTSTRMPRRHFWSRHAVLLGRCRCASFNNPTSSCGGGGGWCHFTHFLFWCEVNSIQLGWCPTAMCCPMRFWLNFYFILLWLKHNGIPLFAN